MIVRIPPYHGEKYILLVQRNNSNGPFGPPGGTQAAFFVDGVRYLVDSKGAPYAVQGFKNHSIQTYEGAQEFPTETIVEFIYGIPFTLMLRNRIRFVTSVEAAKSQKEEQHELEAIWGPQATAEEPPPGVFGEVPMIPVGQYL